MAGSALADDAPFYQDAPLQSSKRNRVTLGDAFVVVAMALVASAFGSGLVLQVGLELWPGYTLGAVAFALMIVGHLALRRAESARRSRRGDMIAAIVTEAGEPSAPAFASDYIRGVPVGSPPGLDDAAATVAGDTATSDPQSGRSGDSSEDATSKPTKAQAPDLGRVRPAAGPELAPIGKPATDINDMIKRLANDIEAGRKPAAKEAGAEIEGRKGPKPAAREGAAGPESSSTKAVLPSLSAGLKIPNQENRRAWDARPAPETGPTLSPGSLLPSLEATPSASVPEPPPLPPAAERQAHKSAPTMTEAASRVAPETAAAPRETTPTAKLAAIADALSDEQLDVYLETINGLEDYRAQHYEVSVRLRLAGGAVIENDAYIAETRGTGLLPLIEAVKVSSTKRLASQMISRGRTGEFFSAIDGEALSDAQFSDDVDTITGGDATLAARLVLTFSQADMRSLTAAQLQSLDAIAALGFRFSVEDITDLDMDFEALAKRGFAFAKLDADVFLNGLPTGTTLVPPYDICSHMAGAGLSVIVGGITEEAVRAKILGFGAVLGQGRLFGAPRPVRANLLRPAGEIRSAAL